MDFSALTEAISFDQVGPVVLGAAAALVALYVIFKGVEFVLDLLYYRGPGASRRLERDGLTPVSGNADRDGDGVGGGNPAHRIVISKSSSLSRSQFSALMEDDEQRKARERGRARYE